ncbi:hypothetical protein CNECB9_470006 [Cupriavidus necator]|uniref:Transposase n=1 Tax=Cupriavidus necator TaxID=106590 RepID=A0A1K0IMQ5_CUPNE|nr:hypothetical protein CNECB9_470006 [Cupriavidus necator]
MPHTRRICRWSSSSPRTPASRSIELAPECPQRRTGRIAGRARELGQPPSIPRALSGCRFRRVRWSDEEDKIALSRSSLSRRRHQLRGALEFWFNLSLRDVEELLLERGVVVTYETIRCWCEKFGANFAHLAKAVRRKPGGTWHLDEMFVHQPCRELRLAKRLRGDGSAHVHGGRSPIVSRIRQAFR